MTPAQQRGIGHFRRHLEQHSIRQSAMYPLAITRFDVRDEKHLVSVSAELEITSLPPGNLLRAIDREYWLVFVGKRGALTAKMGPISLHQFKGKQFIGINIDY